MLQSLPSCRDAQSQSQPVVVRSVFISDIHLGCQHSQADQLLQFLSLYRFEYLYLVGDIIDGRSLRRRWCWVPEFTSVLLRLLDLTRQGTIIRYAIGNHDDFLRHENSLQTLLNLDAFEIAEEFVHTTENNRRFLVLHGDRFDTIEQSAEWVSHAATVVYEALLSANLLWSRLSHFGHSRKYSLSAWIKSRTKLIVRYISEFEAKITAHARKKRCDGVICGHIHTPVTTVIDGLTYCNTGDWIENCTALLEHSDGRFELIYFHGKQQTLCQLPATEGDVLNSDERNSKSGESVARQTSSAPAAQTVQRRFEPAHLVCILDGEDFSE